MSADEIHAVAPATDPQGHGEPESAWREEYRVVTKPYVPIRQEPTSKSKMVSVLEHGEQFQVFNFNDDRSWAHCERPKRKGQAAPVIGWVHIHDSMLGPLVEPIGKQAYPTYTYDLTLVAGEMAVEHLNRRVEENSRLLAEKLKAKKATTEGETEDERLRRLPTVFIARGERLDIGDGRLVLGRAERPQKARQHFESVIVMGAHHTCTTALGRELQRQFDVTVLNYNIPARLGTGNHKHLVRHSEPKPTDALVLCLVKDPCFWIQSLTRNGLLYEVRPLFQIAEGGHARVQEIGNFTTAQLVDMLLCGYVEFEDVIYEGGALGVWEATVRSYFDAGVYPLHRTAVIRSEDFLFRFDEVMGALELLGLSRRLGAGRLEPDATPAKGAQHLGARDRREALAWYSSEENRSTGFSGPQFEQIFQMLHPEVMEPLCYGKEAVKSWTVPPFA